VAESSWRDAIPEEWPIVEPATPLEDAQARLEAAGLGDGLPLVPPTPARLAAMLAGASDQTAVHAAMPPLFGTVTTAAVGYCAVIAGCLPTELPVVLKAAVAMLEPELNLLGIATTTGSAAVATMVHGPLAERLGMNASINCLGPGNRANACIGRAVSLVLRNIGGARAESGDMATVGQPGKYAFCFAEGPGIGWPQLPQRRGFSPADDVVSVVGVSGTAEVLPVEGRDTAEAILDPIAWSMQTAFKVNGAAKQPELSEQVFILPPEMARQIVERGWDLARVCAYLFEATKIDGRPIAASTAEIVPIVTGGPGVKMAHLPLWGGGTRIVTRALIRP
jgi:hypothetical protein